MPFCIEDFYIEKYFKKNNLIKVINFIIKPNFNIHLKLLKLLLKIKVLI
jgi:hypothetical protein